VLKQQNKQKRNCKALANPQIAIDEMKHMRLTEIGATRHKVGRYIQTLVPGKIIAVMQL
jgi:hypothetical protein